MTVIMLRVMKSEAGGKGERQERMYWKRNYLDNSRRGRAPTLTIAAVEVPRLPTLSASEFCFELCKELCATGIGSTDPTLRRRCSTRGLGCASSARRNDGMSTSSSVEGAGWSTFASSPSGSSTSSSAPPSEILPRINSRSPAKISRRFLMATGSPEAMADPEWRWCKLVDERVYQGGEG